MKTLIGILGILIGCALTLTGEFYMPAQYVMNLTYGCWKSKNNPDLVFLPETYIYNQKRKDFIGLYAPSSGAIPSYVVALDILTGELYHMTQDECNVVRELQLNAKDTK